MKIYRCNKCKKIIALVNEGNPKTICCNEDMEEIKCNENDLEYDKHLPSVLFKCDIVIVSVGRILHPSESNHHIEWVLLEFDDGYQIKYLKKNETPVVAIRLCRNATLKAVYSYCNIHGLFKLEINDD